MSDDTDTSLLARMLRYVPTPLPGSVSIVHRGIWPGRPYALRYVTTREDAIDHTTGQPALILNELPFAGAWNGAFLVGALAIAVAVIFAVLSAALGLGRGYAFVSVGFVFIGAFLMGLVRFQPVRPDKPSLAAAIVRIRSGDTSANRDPELGEAHEIEVRNDLWRLATEGSRLVDKPQLRATPILIGLVYLALAPIFATVYNSLPAKSLHDANLELEQPLTADADHLLAALTDLIRPGVTRTWDTTTAHLQIDPSSVRAASIRADGNSGLIIGLAGDYAGKTDHGVGIAGSFQESIQVDVLQRLITVPPGGRPTVAYGVSVVTPNGTSATSSQFAPPLSLLLKPQPGQIFQRSSGLITLSVAVNNRLVRFFNSLQGDPSQASGNWWRMLYFSSTTLTTLGLGDITPVSSQARAWVWVEAVLGLVVIGLFLASITGGVRRKPRP